MPAQAPNTFFATTSEEQSRRARLPRGDRTKLAKRYFADLYAAWEEQGESVLARAAFHDPMGFARMVAGLMPQKLEITHPTDGLSDERLADLLALAERMAELKAAGMPFIDEKRLIDVTPEEGGGGPDRLGDAAGRVVTTHSADAPKSRSDETSNRLKDVPSTSERLIAEESTYATQPPVGKPCATMPLAEQRDNLRKLHEDIDPASLF